MGLNPPLAHDRCQWDAPAQSASRISGLDGLRAVAVVLVILVHMSFVGQVPHFLFHISSLGVQILFVISGYLITTLLTQEREQLGAVDLKAFYLRRFFRIVPAAYCFLAIVIVFYWTVFRPVDILSLSTFTLNYSLGRPIVVAHLWPLSAEVQFYILWSIALKLFFHQRLRILVCALCLSPFVIIAFHFLHLNAYRGLAFPTTYDSLALGCLAAVLGSKLEFLGSRWFLLCAPLAVIFQWPMWTTKISGLVHVFFLWPMTHLCVAIFMVHAIYRRYWLLNWRPVAWLGSISYSLCLWHNAFLVQPRLLPGFPPLWMLGSAILSYYLIERPFIPLRKRFRRIQTA